MNQDKQLALFPAGAARQAVTRADIVLAKRVARMVRVRGALSETDLAEALGCDRGSLRFAVGIAAQWRRVIRANGYVIPVAPDEGATRELS